MSPAAVATALRVVATAVLAELVVNRPSIVDIYGRGLEPSEIRWLLDGMPDAQMAVIPDAPAGDEDMQLVGTLLGRPYRVLLVGRDHAGLIGDLALVLAGRAIRARRRVGASAR